jgi:PTS system nitrogen regulatory IIA component
MQLTVHEAARFLRVSDNVVYEWILREQLPASRYHGNFTINRVRLIEWAFQNQKSIIMEGSLELRELGEALTTGGVNVGVPGNTLKDILQQVLIKMPLQNTIDRHYLWEMLQVRQNCGWTHNGDGIAVPHPRAPIIIPIEKPLVSLSYPENPQQFGKQNATLVFALFTLVASSFPMYLNLLSQISFALDKTEFSEVIKKQSDLEAILSPLNAISKNIQKTIKS